MSGEEVTHTGPRVLGVLYVVGVGVGGQVVADSRGEDGRRVVLASNRQTEMLGGAGTRVGGEPYWSPKYRKPPGAKCMEGRGDLS